MKRENKLIQYLYQIPLYLSIIVLPVLVRFSKVVFEAEQQAIFPAKAMVDIFVHTKFNFLMVILFLNVLILGINYKKILSFIKKDKVLWLMLAFLGALVVSTVTSPYPYTSIMGFFQSREGLLSWLAYFSLFLNGYVFLNKESLKGIVVSVYTSVFLVSSIVLLQYFGIDILNNTVLKELLIFPNEYLLMSNEIMQSIVPLSGTLFNPNYVGSYFAIMLPVILLFTRFDTWKSVGFVFFALGFAAMLASKSSAGMVAVLVSVLIFILLQGKEAFKKPGNGMILLIMLVLGLAFNSSIESNITDITSPVSGETEAYLQKRVVLDKIDIEENYVLLRTNQNEDVGVLLEGPGSMKFVNENLEGIPYRYDPETRLVTFDNDKHQYMQLKFYNGNVFSALINGTEVPFLYQNQDIYLLGPDKGIINHEPVEHFGFEGYERIGSGRGYIWSRSLPLIFDRPLFGYGPGTYALAFPQHDVAGKVTFFSQAHLVVDKPHNFYLMLLITTGFIGFTLYFSFVVGLLLKLLMHKKLKRYFPLLASFFIVLLFNDSTIFTSAMMYGFMGLMISNHEEHLF